MITDILYSVNMYILFCVRHSKLTEVLCIIICMADHSSEIENTALYG